MKLFAFAVFLTFVQVGIAHADPIKDPGKWMSDLCNVIINGESKAAKMVISAMDFGSTQRQSQIQSQELAFQGAFEQATKYYGKLKACSYGDETKIGEDLKKVTHVAKYSIMPTVLEGYFVKHSNGWKVFGVSFLDQKEQFPFK